MKKSLIACASLAACLALPSFAQQQITVVNFGGANANAQKKAFYEPYEKAGNKLVAVEYNGEQAKIKAMVEAKNVSWDVVEVESPELARGCEEGLYEKLDYSKIGPKADFVPAAVNECGVGIFVWSTALAYNADRLKEAPTSWADFWNARDFPGRRALRKHPFDTLEEALMASGVPNDKVYPLDLDRAFKALDQIKPKVDVWWNSGAQVEQMLKSGEVDLIATWVSRPQSANADGANIGIVWNQNIWGVDSWSILAGTPNADACREFIKFASEPQRMASLVQYFAAGVTQPEAFKHIKPELAKHCPTFPENIKNGLQIDARYWLANQAAVIEKFNGWVLK